MNEINEHAIKIKLDLLAEIQASTDLINLKKQELIDQILTPEIKAKIADIEAEFAPKFESANKASSALMEEVKKLVLENSGSVKGTFLHAIYGKGRISWDAKSLDGYAIAHPEILYMRKEGEPSVSIRRI
jgi:hypothetical protein